MTPGLLWRGPMGESDVSGLFNGGSSAAPQFAAESDQGNPWPFSNGKYSRLE